VLTHLQVHKLEHRKSLLKRKVDKWSELVATISRDHVPRLDHMLCVSLKEGCSPLAIRDKIIAALGKTFRASRSYSPREVNAGLLGYCIGGARITYAMSKAFGTPSLRTLKNALLDVVIKPCLRGPDNATIRENLVNVVQRLRGNLPSLPPFLCHLAVDESTLVACAMYMRIYNTVGGICPCAPESLKLAFDKYADAEHLRDQLRPSDGSAPTIHFANQATVAAVTVHDPKNSDPIPFLVAGGCGKKNAESSAGLFERFFRVWENSGMHKILGWFLSIATDGDSSRRRGGYMTLLRQELDPNGELYKVLVKLQGMNLFVGPHNVTLDFDRKHIIKSMSLSYRSCSKVLIEIAGMSTCIRGKSGMSIRGRIITPGLLSTYLERMGLSPHKVHTLLEPDDAQNVVAAVELIQALKRIDRELKPQDPSDKQDIKAICAFAHLYGSFVEAFTNHTLSLSKQMRLLSTYSHLAMVMYRSDKQRFISSQLYADSQTCVKNMFFCLAKQQLLDPTQKFYLFMHGSNGVERLFAMMRMIGGHKPNVNILELCQNLGRGMDIQRIFMEHPEWYSGHRRLSTARGDKADHLSVLEWEGDVIAGHVVLLDEWNNGATDAQQTLYHAGFTRTECAWPLIFASPNTDIIRPFGDGIYVGVPSAGNADDEPDRSLDESVEIPDESELETRMNSASAGADLSNPDEDIDSDDDSDTGSVIAEADVEDLDGLEPSNSDDSLSLQVEGPDAERDESMPSLTELTEMVGDLGEDDEDDDEDLSTDIDQTGEALAASPLRKGRNDAHYVEFEGRPLHKATVIRVLLNSDCTKKQSKDRLQRVRTYTSASVNSSNLGDDNCAAAPCDTFKAGDCFATLIRSDRDISLAIMRCTHIYRCGKLIREPVPWADVPQPKARITLQGQVLSFVELHRGLRITRPGSTEDGDAVEGADDEEGEVSAQEETWIWDHETVRLRPVKPSARAQDVLSLTVLGFTTLPFNPPSALVSRADDTAAPHPDATDTHLTWALSHGELSGLLAQLWGSLKAPGTVSKLARCGASARFPYLSIQGML
jgi:hypothetical protein